MDGKWGYIKTEGTYIIEPKFDGAWALSDGIALVKMDGKWGYIKTDGTFLVEPQFNDAGEFRYGKSTS